MYLRQVKPLSDCRPRQTDGRQEFAMSSRTASGVTYMCVATVTLSAGHTCRARSMRRTLVRLMATLLAALAIAEGWATAVHATIQPETCLAPDIEYPVPCDEDDD